MTDPGEIRRYADLGVSRLVLSAPIQQSCEVRAALERFAENIMAKV
jgi:hypothetical protein